MQLNTKLGQLTQQQQACIQTLTPDRIQALAIALLDFTQIDDLDQWLDLQE